MKLSEFSVNRRVTATMMVLILVVLGGISFTRLGLDFFPDIEFPTVSVVTTYSGASSEDIETTITKPIEEVVSSVSRIKKVTSMTSEGVSAVMAEFEWGTNLDFAAQDIRDQIGLYANFLPPDASDPLVVKFNFSQFPVLFWGVTSDMPPFQLKKVLEDEVKPRLERIDGVASVPVFATDVREIQVNVDKAAMETRGLTLERIILALQASNANMPAGNLVERHSDLLVRTMGEFESLEDIRRTVVGASAKGEPIYLSDLAEVKDTIKDVRYEARVQGKKGVFLMVNKQSGANTAIVGTAVHRELDAVRGTLPPDIAFNQVMDMSDMIKMVTKRTSDNAWQGAILAIALIFLFLLNWRPTVIIALAIPISIITTFIAMYAAGYTLNMLTLGGLALGVGMLVDNAIVVIENTFRHVQEGKGPKAAAIVGASEVGMAISASTLTTIVVFLPMVFASGITAKFTRGLALAVTFSLVSSLFVALTIVPLLASFLFKRGTVTLTSEAAAITETGLKGRLLRWAAFEGVRAWYRRALEATLRRRKLALGLVGLAFVLSMAAVPFLGTEFMPVMDQDMLFIKLGMPVGTSLAETNRVCLMVEDLARNLPEVKIITAQVGSQAEVNPSDSASEMSASGTHEAILYIGLNKKETRKRSGAEVLESLRNGLPKINGLKFDTLDVSSGFMGGTRTPVDIKLYGKDLELLKSLATAMVERIKDVPGIRDASHSLAAGKPEYHLHLDRVRAAQLGLMVGQVGSTVQAATVGRVATRYRDADEEIDIRVRFQERYRDSIEEVRTIPLVTAANRTVYVDQVATLEEGSGPIQISRENQSRRVSLTANVVGRDLGSVIRDVRGRLAAFEKDLPSGYFLEYGGAYEQMMDAFKVLFAAFALATLLVYMVMASQFESLKHPFIIMFTVPLGFIGVVAGLFLWGMTVNMVALIGFILLEGIAVNNGIVLIDYINQLVRSGVEKREAILRGSATRLRPVLLTALTTILGMLPMALTKSSGAEMRAPIGVTVLSGLVATTFLTLFVIPIIYSLFEKVSFKKAEAPRS